MNTPKYVIDRAKRLHSICSHLKTTIKLPLLVEIPIPVDLFKALHNYINIYLFESLTEYYQDHYFDLSNNMLVKYHDDIIKLPNITGNGLLLPKQYSFLSFNMIQRTLCKIMRHFNFTSIKKYHAPAHIRIINGIPNNDIDSRPRASTKLHSDICSGDYSNLLSFTFPISGDFSAEGNGVEYYEPRDSFFPEYCRPLNDFNEMARLINDSTKYNILTKPGNIYLIDTFLLHRTMKRKPGLRLTTHFAGLYDNSLETDLDIKTDRSVDYFDEDWYKFGTEKLIHTNKKARIFTKEEINVSQNKYAASFNIVDLPID